MDITQAQYFAIVALFILSWLLHGFALVAIFFMILRKVRNRERKNGRLASLNRVSGKRDNAINSSSLYQISNRR